MELIANSFEHSGCIITMYRRLFTIAIARINANATQLAEIK